MSTTTEEHFGLGREVAGGAFHRQRSTFRRRVSADGTGDLPAEPGRYHLYVCLACPWSHRAVLVHALKGLGDAIGISYADPYRDARGWAFSGGRYVDEINGFAFLAEAYERTEAGYGERVTVPVLWDRETGQVVSNESADIVRMLGREWDAWAAHPELDLYPEAMRAEIDALNTWIYRDVQNGVYRAGFSTTQEAYEEAFRGVVAGMAELERLLSERRYLAGDVLTEADWRLLPTLVRFDPVYYLHFRCNGRRLVDHPNLWGYTRALFQVAGVAETVAMDEIKRHYYTTHDMLNPRRIIPAGPLDFDLSAPHGRG